MGCVNGSRMLESDCVQVMIRAMRPDERERFLERIVHTSWNDLPHYHRERRAPGDIAPGVRHIVELLMAQGDNVVLVADVEGRPNKGQVWLGEARDPYSGARRGYIYDLYVEPDMRGQGLGRALLRAAEEASTRRGDRELGLTVAAGNEEALALYGNMGFAVERLTMSKVLERG
jgi:GNAT superfamily N-acetyltransferase